jgi:hypothetical protein
MRKFLKQDAWVIANFRNWLIFNFLRQPACGGLQQLSSQSSQVTAFILFL